MCFQCRAQSWSDKLAFLFISVSLHKDFAHYKNKKKTPHMRLGRVQGVHSNLGAAGAAGVGPSAPPAVPGSACPPQGPAASGPAPGPPSTALALPGGPGHDAGCTRPPPLPGTSRQGRAPADQRAWAGGAAWGLTDTPTSALGMKREGGSSPFSVYVRHISNFN